ncbi:protein rotatin homolog [Anopheles ziemanni]|uniref:protein rotatin homolog n=1 Tax=Anopheles coustani TaxID=139045 RepID=UPI00265943EB|nr:protein rotatin homolog [Anopheles coustani]XP_058170184.1 protein rotatin homolog [Anopheles ziemanni]
MAIVINQLMLDKLVHEIKEIRIRTLQDVDNKLKRALWDHVEIKFSAPALFKNLIRWFGHYPIYEEVVVLKLMSLLLASEYATEIVQFFTAERIIKELNKIRYLLGTESEHLMLVEFIIQQVGVFKPGPAKSLERDGLADLETEMANMDLASEGPACRLQAILDELESRWTDKETLYTNDWEIPTNAVASRLESFNDSLLMDDHEKSLQLGLSYVIPYTKNYPAEFFLRPPYICLSLVRLVRLRRVSIRAGFEMLLHLLEALRKRVRQRCTAAMYMPPESTDAKEKSQLSICAFVYELLMLGTELLKENSSDLDLMASNMIFLVFHNAMSFSLPDACSMMENFPATRFAEVRNELGYLLKHFRQEWESNSKNSNARLRHRMVLQTMVDLIDHWNKVHDNNNKGATNVGPATSEAGKYNPSDFATMNSTGHQRALEEMDDTWLHEVHLALLDYPLQKACPDTYQHLLLLTAIAKGDMQRIRILGAVPSLLESVVELIRSGPAAALELSHNELVALSPNAIKMAFLHRSFGLIRMIMNALGRCASSITEDCPLWDTVETLTINLLAERDDEIRCEVYDVCLEMVKKCAAALDECTILKLPKLAKNLPPKLRAIGIPLSLQILTEIICFGYTSPNSKIRQCAEMILLILCNGKMYLGVKWADLQEILVPVMPILQMAVVGSEETQIRKTVIGMLHPDFGLPWLVMLQGNLRLLFHEDRTLRQEAMSRVLFLLTTVEQPDKRMIPRLEHISDTIPHDLCLVKYPYDPPRPRMTHEKSQDSVPTLLAILESEDSEPGLRRSTLVQLNRMAADPEICELIHNLSGWVPVLKALSNSLREDHCHDAPQSAIPAVGILTKLCFTVLTFRRFLGSNENAYTLIVRSLLCYHHNPEFRAECVALVYLLLFADCSIGSGVMVSLPALFRNPSFRLPFLCLFHWEYSPFRLVNLIEILTQGRAVGEHELQLDWGSGSILRVDERTLLQQVRLDGGYPRLGDELPNLTAGSTSVSWSSTYREYLMRYIRFAFADLWFGGLDKVLKAIKNHRKQNGTTTAADLAPIEYSGRGVAGTPIFGFNRDLRLTKQDLRWLKIVDNASTLRKVVRRITTAKTHKDVYGYLATLEANMFFPTNSTECLPDEQITIDTLQRYFLAPPTTNADQQLLVVVLSTVGNMIEYGEDKILGWVIGMLSAEGENLFIKLLRSETTCIELYAKTVRFLRVVLLALVRNYLISDDRHQQQTIDKAMMESVWDVQMFHAVGQQMDHELQVGNFGRVFLLVGLLEVLSGHVARKCLDVAQIVPKMLQYIRETRSTSYTGSTIVLSSLVAIRELIGSTTVILKPAHFRLLSTLCGHSCPLIRTCAWNVLARLATKEANAKMIVQDCDYLPGGIHACCVSTLLDEREACLVRESAACLLTNLFSHLVDRDGVVWEVVLPQDCAFADQPRDPKDPLALVKVLLAKQDFFRQSVRSLQHYVPKHYLTDSGRCAIPVQGPIVSAELVQAYAIIYRSLLEMSPTVFGPLIFEKGCLQGLLNCIAVHPFGPSLSHPQWLLVAEICGLIMRCIQEPNRFTFMPVLTANQRFFERIMSLLRPTDYGTGYSPQFVCQSNIMHMLNTLMQTTLLCKKVIRLAFAEANILSIAQLICEELAGSEEVIQMACHDFLVVQINDANTREKSPFLNRLEALDMLNDEDDLSQSGDSRNSDDDSNGEEVEEEEEDEEETEEDVEAVAETANAGKEGGSVKLCRSSAQNSGSGRIFMLVLNQFKDVVSSLPLTRCGMGQLSVKGQKIFSTMQMMLYASPKCRQVAWECGLLEVLVELLNALYQDGIGGLTYAEFVRKYGEAKKGPYVNLLTELLRTMICWFVAKGEALQLQQDQINALCRVVLNFWSWSSGSELLKLSLFQTLGALSADSIFVCKSLAATFTGYPHSIIKLLIVTVTTETARVKATKNDLPTLALAVRVLMQCCCCQEGRSTISKLHLLDNISKLHPSVTRLQKPWPEVTRLWLEFWEHYSRYEDGCEVKHLTVLGALVRRSDHDLRHFALAIIRNLTFVNANRPALLASSDYMFMLQSALNRSASRGEQTMATVTVWKMIANNHKGRAAIKASPLIRHIAELVKFHSMTAEGNEQDDLWNALMTVYRILQA